jgi:hypothetical protein
MHRLELSVTGDEWCEVMRDVRREGVSVSDFLRKRIGMRPNGDPPFYASREPRVRLHLVHGEHRPQRR